MSLTYFKGYNIYKLPAPRSLPAGTLRFVSGGVTLVAGPACTGSGLKMHLKRQLRKVREYLKAFEGASRQHVHQPLLQEKYYKFVFFHLS